MPDNETIESQLAASIASAGTPDYKAVEIPSEATEVAPDDGNQPAAAPSSEQPTDESTVQEVQPTETKPVAQVTAQKVAPSATPAETVKSDKQPDEDAIMRESLGLP